MVKFEIDKNAKLGNTNEIDDYGCENYFNYNLKDKMKTFQQTKKC